MINSLYHIIRTNPHVGRLALRAIPDLRWQVSVRDVGLMSVNLRKNRSYWLRDPVRSEKFVLGALQRLVRRGDVVFDVGANIGLHTRFLVQVFGAGKVIAFEPVTENVRLLTKNMELGHCERQVEIRALALADFDGKDQFQIDDVSSASGTLNAVTGGEASEARRQYGFAPLTKEVAVARLDTLIEQSDVPVPNVIKIDVEGAEDRLLRGATGVLRKHVPNLVIEFHSAEAAQSAVRQLLSAGYYVFGYLNTESEMIYREIELENVAQISDRYSLQFCTASANRELISTHTDYRE